ncbi:Uncharacterized protein dnm_090730 [Desulfonema magnum]|uniref:Uncharacterized protein n=1 Tax=Desulfonema magnum TaxID=45655 RepID=A0A975BXH2_9BACT|nr:Uncharacterized protein dnm_090730 [Desulfonema magnum]
MQKPNKKNRSMKNANNNQLARRYRQTDSAVAGCGRPYTKGDLQ